jgi:hypothetical protein
MPLKQGSRILLLVTLYVFHATFHGCPHISLVVFLASSPPPSSPSHHVPRDLHRVVSAVVPSPLPHLHSLTASPLYFCTTMSSLAPAELGTYVDIEDDPMLASEEGEGEGKGNAIMPGDSDDNSAEPGGDAEEERQITEVSLWTRMMMMGGSGARNNIASGNVSPA